MKITVALGNLTNAGWVRTELGLSSTKGVDSMKDVTMSKYLSHQRKVNFQGQEVKRGLALGLEISACWALGNGVSICTALEWTHLGYALIYGPRKVFGSEDSICRETSRRRASVRVWRDRSLDLGQSGRHQLSVGGEMGCGWPDLQTQFGKMQKKKQIQKSQKMTRSARVLKVSFSYLGPSGSN